jgi:hypothetical protein
MTPKEKAEQLVRKYYTFGLNNPAQSFSWYECKECSLIAVDEILDQQNEFMQTKEHYNYWKQVKQQIQKL